MPILKPINHPGDLAQIINYCNMDGVRCNQNDVKGLTFGINCSGLAEQAVADMRQVKKLYRKEGKRQYQHFILSFAQNEFAKGDPKVYQEALNYGIKLASKIWGKRYQVFLALHTNSRGVESGCEDGSNGGCLHIHIIINSVSIVDGSKIRSSKDDLNLYRSINDSIAKEYGFNVIDRTPEAVALRDRPQIYDNNAYQIYLRTKRVPKRNIRLLTFQSVIKLSEKILRIGKTFNPNYWRMEHKQPLEVLISPLDILKKKASNTILGYPRWLNCIITTKYHHTIFSEN